MYVKIFFLLFLFCLPAHADRAVQRVQFQQAEAALAAGHSAEFEKLSRQLHDYPLFPYLRYAELQQRIQHASEEEVLHFLRAYADTPLAAKLRKSWLYVLMAQQRWPLFFEYYQPTNDPGVQCGYLHGLLARGEQQQAFTQLSHLWQSGEMGLLSCEPVFAAWKKSGGLTTDLLWQHLQIAMDKNNQPLIAKLTAWLPAELHAKIKLWQQVRENPGLVMHTHLFLPLDSYTKPIVIDGIKRFLRKNPQYVVEQWPHLKESYHFHEPEEQLLTKLIALALARNLDPEALVWMAKLKPTYIDADTQAWHIRLLLLERKWEKALFLIEELPPSERNKNSWRYWEARALAATGYHAEAQAIFHSLKQHVDYYAWRAAQQLREAYRPSTTTYPEDSQQMTQIMHMASAQRAAEFYALHRLLEARQEWQWMLTHVDKSRLSAAAQLAKQWHWYDRIMATLRVMNARHNLQFGYPLAFDSEVKSVAKQENISAAWIFSVMRQESDFAPDARSWVGALGLMQLMPQTAKMLAKTRTLPNLFNPSVNIHLGSSYLRQLSDKYQGNQVIATAAYNMGGTRLKTRIPLYEKEYEDIWIELLPLNETREYVKNVLFGEVIYQKKLTE